MKNLSTKGALTLIVMVMFLVFSFLFFYYKGQDESLLIMVCKPLILSIDLGIITFLGIVIMPIEKD